MAKKRRSTKRKNPYEPDHGMVFSYRDTLYFIANPDDWSDSADGHTGLFEFQFSHGGIGKATHVLVWDAHMESALEVATEWLVEHAPGLLTTHKDAYKDAKADIIASGKGPATAGLIDAWVDDTYIYTENGYLTHGNWWSGEVTNKTIYRKALVDSVRSDPDRMEEYEAEKYKKALKVLKTRKSNPSKKTKRKATKKVTKRKSSKSVSSLVSRALK